MSDVTELLEHARKLERLAEADDVLGDPVPVRRKVLREACEALRRAYTEVQTGPAPEEVAVEEIEGLRRLCRWFQAAIGLDDSELITNLPPDLLASAVWLWAEDRAEQPEEQASTDG